ncbi:MAG: T9SS type A sorting domain-containing protein [Saprospiraceae bacterium]
MKKICLSTLPAIARSAKAGVLAIARSAKAGVLAIALAKAGVLAIALAKAGVLALIFSSTLPAQILQFQARGVGGGGALFFPRVNPGNDQEFYVSCDMSQLFHTTDFGDNYTQIPFQTLQVFGANSTYEWTIDPNVAYCNHNDGNNGYPVRTMNGGLSWQPLPGHDPNNENVYRMAANYEKPNQLLINYYGAIFISNNFGSTFQLVKQAANNGVGLIMGGTFFDGENIYIGTNEGIFRSTNGGNSFALMATNGISAGQIIWSFAAGKSGKTTRFVCITADASDVYNGVMPWEYWGFAKGVYVMDNASGVWQSKSTDIDFDNDFVMYAAMAWNDPNTIYLGGNDNALGAPLVFKSSNGGTAWEKVFRSMNNENISTGWSGFGGDKAWSWGETCFGISVAPFNSGKVLFSDFGFVHVSDNGGDDWKQAYLKVQDQNPANVPTPKRKPYTSIGLENTTAWQLHWHDQNEMLTAFSDIGMIRSTDGGNRWGFNYTGLSVNSVYRILESPANNFMLAATSSIHDMYQSTRLTDALLDANDNSGKIFHSSDGGSSWQLLHNFGHPVFWVANDPNSPTSLYASVIHYGGGGANMKGGIWHGTYGGAWTQLPAPPRTEGHPASIVVLNDGKVACTFSGRRNASGTFTPSSGVFLYDPATNTWADRSHTDMYYWTKDIVIDPADASQNTWYVGVFSGWGGAPNGKGGLYRTTNCGQNWTKLTGSKFDRVTSLTFNPLALNQAYLTTETQGLWVSNNMNATTPDWSLVESYPFRQPERVFFNPYKPSEIWVTSFGNGLKVAQTTSSTYELPDYSPCLRVWPNPVADGMVQLELPEVLADQNIVISDAMGRVIWQGQRKLGVQILELNVQGWVSGMYMVKCGAESGWFIKI